MLEFLQLFFFILSEQLYKWVLLSHAGKTKIFSINYNNVARANNVNWSLAGRLCVCMCDSDRVVFFIVILLLLLFDNKKWN